MATEKETQKSRSQKQKDDDAQATAQADPKANESDRNEKTEGVTGGARTATDLQGANATDFEGASASEAEEIDPRHTRLGDAVRKNPRKGEKHGIVQPREEQDQASAQ